MKKLFSRIFNRFKPEPQVKVTQTNFSKVTYVANDIESIVKKPFPQVLYAEIPVANCSACVADSYTIGTPPLCIYCYRKHQH